MQNVMKRLHIPFIDIFCAESGSKITHRVNKVSNNFTVDMDAKFYETCSYFIFCKYRLTLVDFWRIFSHTEAHSSLDEYDCQRQI